MLLCVCVSRTGFPLRRIQRLSALGFAHVVETRLPPLFTAHENLVSVSRTQGENAEFRCSPFLDSVSAGFPGRERRPEATHKARRSAPPPEPPAILALRGACVLCAQTILVLKDGYWNLEWQ